MTEVVELLTRLVAAPSVSGQEGPAASIVEEWATKHGFEAKSPHGWNRLVVREAAAPGPTLLLLSHLDTVPATSQWTRPPWAPTQEGARLYGLGANDAKGCLAAMMLAFRDAPLPRGRLILAAAAEEETGREGFERVAGTLPPIDAAIVGEPTGLDVATAQNGLLILDCVARGRAGHAARPHLADNAISILARDIVAVEALTLDRLHPVAGRTTHAVTIAHAGDRHNVIPGEARWTIDLRTTDAYTTAELVAAVRGVVRSEVVVRSDRFAAVSTPGGARILGAARRARPEAREFASPTLSDWAHLRGIPAIKWGPGRSEVSHTADEWVELASVEDAVGAYTRAIAAYFEEA